MARLDNIARSIKTDPTHPYHQQAIDTQPTACIRFLHRQDPQITDNQQCFYLSATGARTFAAAEAGIGRYGCVIAPQGNPVRSWTG